MSKRTLDELFDSEPAPSARPVKQFPCTKGKGIMAGTKLARDLFLNGNGDGKPITDTVRLMEKTGISKTTIEKWRPVWERERREMIRAANNGKQELASRVTGESVALHTETVSVLESELARLRKLLPTLPEGTDVHASTLKLLSATLARWEVSSGFAAHVETMEVYQKEMAKMAARMQGKAGSTDERNVTPGFEFIECAPDKKGPPGEGRP